MIVPTDKEINEYENNIGLDTKRVHLLKPGI
jgi:hypothetical protein